MASDESLTSGVDPASGADMPEDTQVAAVPERRPASAIRTLYETQRSLEKLRIQQGNRKYAIEQGNAEIDAAFLTVYAQLFDSLVSMESAVDKALAKALDDQPVWNHWLKHVKGIGPSLAAAMLALLLPPLPERGPSTWYKAAGLVPQERCATCGGLIELRVDPVTDPHCPICGTGENIELVDELVVNYVWHCEDCDERFEEMRPEAEGFPRVPYCPKCATLGGETIMRLPKARVGEGKTTYHRWLRRCLFLVATSFVRSGGYYRAVYDREKARLSELHRGDTLRWPPHRLDDVARWATIKLFLSHLWEKWLEAEGQTGRQAYVVDQLGHKYIAPPTWGGAGKI